ncbi:MAG: hemerythrin domain-containing protein [Euryarchaeota archaeon]|nr:hemerythrin domain-containing protein [Euryarchaeota archaeon]
MADDAIQMLKDDHKKVKQLLKDLTSGSGDKKETLRKIEKEVQTHTHLEETIFYPAYRKELDTIEGKDLVEESLEEHHLVDKILEDLNGLKVDSAEFRGRCTVLKEMIEHHIKDEEKEMLPKAEKQISKTKLEEIGKRMKQEKQEFKPERVIKVS